MDKDVSKGFEAESYLRILTIFKASESLGA